MTAVLIVNLAFYSRVHTKSNFNLYICNLLSPKISIKYKIRLKM